MLSFVCPKVMVYAVGAFAKIDCDTISITHVRLTLAYKTLIDTSCRNPVRPRMMCSLSIPDRISARKRLASRHFHNLHEKYFLSRKQREYMALEGMPHGATRSHCSESGDVVSGGRGGMHDC